MKINYLKLSAFVFIFFICLFPLKIGAVQEIPFPDPETTVSMDFQDANLKDIMKIFSIQSGMNFIASEAVQDRRLTLYLDKVPIKDAMDKIFRANNLSYELDKRANIFIVKDWGKPQIETITKVFHLKYHNITTSKFGKEVARGGGDLLTTVKEVMSESGKITEDSRDNSLIVTEIPSNMSRVTQLIASLDVPQPQVMLEVEILDVSKDSVDKLGFDFFSGNNNPITFILPGGFARRGAQLYFGNKSTRNTEGAITLGHTYAEVLDFFRSQADTKYLARPRVLTLNNETAEISVTKDEIVGYNEKMEITDKGDTIITREYIRSTDLKLTGEGTGIFLKVTPQINPSTGEITLVILPKSSVTSPSAIGTNQSDAEVRSTKSVIKLNDGDTVIMGGLIHTEKKVTERKLPIFGDIPLVGMLFRHKDKTKDFERELMIFITPRIVKDTNTRLAQAKKVIPSLEREQDMAPGIGRQGIVDASLNRFESSGR